MIKVIIYKTNINHIGRYTISGHSGYDIKGQDIICAAVSVLGQNTLNSLVEICGIREDEIDYFIDEENGFLDVRIPRDIDDDTRIKTETVLRTLELGIKSIMESYPGYITLKYGEV
jgi:uncharacterized protein YsxB (DUF464 family)